MTEEEAYVIQNAYEEQNAPNYNLWVYQVSDNGDPQEGLEYDLPNGDGYYRKGIGDDIGWEGFQYYEDVLGTNPHRNIVYNTYAGTDIVAQIVVEDEVITLGELQTLSYSIHRENVPVRVLGHVNPLSFVRGPRTIAGSLIFTVFNSYAFYRLKSMRTAIQHNGVYGVADMIPPFDMVLTFSNESGAASKLRIMGVQIIDEGQTMSIDDLVTEQTFSFMARGIQPMTAFTYYTEREIDEQHGATISSRYNL